MAKKSVSFSQDPHEVRLTKEQVLGRMAEGLYLEFPEQWVPDATGYTLDPWQNNLIRTLFLGNEAVSGDTILDWKEEKKARLSCKASHGAGKSFLAGILTNMFMGLYVPSRVAITGPTGKQTRAQVWNYISAVWNRSVFKEDIDWYRTTMSYKINPGEWFATWLTSKEPKSIEGFHGPENGENLLWIVEESKGVADGVFEAIQGALSAKNNYWYISSTCGTAHGFFFDTFHSKKELWDNVSVPYHDSTRISLQQVKKWEKTWGRDSSIFKARVLAEFPDESDKIICPLSWYERAIVRDDDDELDEVA